MKSIVETVTDAIIIDLEDSWATFYYFHTGRASFALDHHKVRFPEFSDYQMMCDCENFGTRNMIR